MRIALIDADMLCYRIGFACDKEVQAVALKTMDNFITDLLCNITATEWELYLTGKDNFRNDYAVTVPYKGNRDGMKRPQHLQALRDYLVKEWDANVTEGEEADDAIAIRATELGDESMIVSLDKDFDQVQGWHYNFVKDNLYYVTKEEGILNFYMQFLTGDKVDNIIGVKGIGPVKAKKLLEGLSEEEMFNVCVDKLGSKERAIENGMLLYLRRTPNELWSHP